MQHPAQLVPHLIPINKHKALNATQNKILHQAHQFFLTQLQLIKQITQKQIKTFS
ncbi:hypothetical protein [Bacillus pumilus]|uniref:hypothetical protein n=1 Tax=Bacillus pumilus TaxID=1408 RepID=UPI0037038D2C